MKVGDEVYIINESGELVKSVHRILKLNTNHKNVYQVKCIATNDTRMVYKDRVVCIENGEVIRGDFRSERSKKLTKKMEKFDVNVLKEDGILFKNQSQKKHGDQPDSMVVETFCLVSADGTKQKYFNLYNGSLGKRSQKPEFTQRDVVNASIAGDMDAIEESLKAKGYARVF